ncbi:MAG: J domain-containing protein [Telluria sp.]|nr:J domain-containing protein [Telluria sp.]
MNPAPTLQLLHAALLDYQRHPGRHAVVRKEPALLFAFVSNILQIAAGRADGEHNEELRRAACTFVRSALIYPDADHYAVLGLGRGCDPATVKEHYRLMMRLMHPDFAAASGTAWPADAATRLNLAYQVLASPAKRAQYDAQLSPASLQPTAKARRAVPPAAAAKPIPRDPRKILKLLAGGFGAAGIAGAAALLLTGGERDTLVQRPVPVLAAVSPPAPAPAPPLQRPAAALPALAAIAPPADLTPPPPASESGSARAAVPPAPVAAATMIAAAPLPAPPLVPARPPELLALPGGVAAPAPQPNTGLTLLEAQPLLATLLQHVESGNGERVLSMLDREARSAPAAQAVSRQVDGLGEGGRPVKLSHVKFRAEPAEGRLFVIGDIQVKGGETAAAPARKLLLRVEFVSRGGAATITGLSAMAPN